MDFTFTRMDLVLKSHFFIFNERQYLRPSISFCLNILLENTIFPLFWRDGRFILKNGKSGHNSEKELSNIRTDQFIDKFFQSTAKLSQAESFQKIEPFSSCQDFWNIELDHDFRYFTYSKYFKYLTVASREFSKDWAI